MGHLNIISKHLQNVWNSSGLSDKKGLRSCYNTGQNIKSFDVLPGFPNTAKGKQFISSSFPSHLDFAWRAAAIIWLSFSDSWTDPSEKSNTDLLYLLRGLL